LSIRESRGERGGIYLSISRDVREGNAAMKEAINQTIGEGWQLTITHSNGRAFTQMRSNSQ